MKTIELHSLVPEIFASRENLRSDIWLADFRFERGKSYLIEAQSGLGKSSLCSYIYGQRSDYRGEILFDGEDISRLTMEQWCGLRERSLSTLFQDLKLFGELTALENVEIKNQLTGYQSQQRIVEWFEELGIGDKLHSRVDRMSFGQQQRVALIRALCQPIDFLLLDEPVSHLDEANSNIMRDVIVRELGRQGAGLIATSIGKHMDMEYDKILHL